MARRRSGATRVHEIGVQTTINRAVWLWAGLTAAATLAVFAIVLIAILDLNRGHFTYALDDPYIHLALAENILRGVYGINLEEASSPSSSIAFPFLLAGFLQIGLGVFGPLVLNLACLILTAFLLWRIFARHGFAGAPNAPAAAAICTVAALICLNGIGVAFTGMEHSLQILATIAAGYGLIVASEGRMPPWLPYVLAAQILIRFEGGAIVLAGLVVLLFHRQWTAAAIALAGTAAILAAHASFMTALGLPILPSSVAIKSAVAGAAMDQAARGSVGSLLVENFLGNLTYFGAVGLHLFALLCLWCIACPPRSMQGRTRPILTATLIAIFVHDAAGRYGWLARYELYILYFALVMGAYAFRPYLQAALARALRWRIAAIGAVALLLTLLQGPGVLLQTPFAANNIHEQQYQMHRFVTEFYKNAVAVNDLGYVSYANDSFVLDLWGLGNERARLARAQGAPGWLAAIVADYKIGLVLVYEDWFRDQIPASWKKAAELRLAGHRVIASRDTVAFFVTNERECRRVVDLTRTFGPTLPAGVTLTLFDEACGH